MIFIDKNTTMGSKKFMYELADAVRPSLDKIWAAEQVDDFDLDLYQQMIHLGYISEKEFNSFYQLVKKINSIDKKWQEILLNYMQADPRFNAQNASN